MDSNKITDLFKTVFYLTEDRKRAVFPYCTLEADIWIHLVAETVTYELVEKLIDHWHE